MEISAVIPTRNRKESLYRLLRSLSNQTYRLKEVAIVDSSDVPLHSDTLRRDFPRLTILFSTSAASVCLQRNIGIRNCSSSHILLCDDDLEFPENYLAILINSMLADQTIGSISGLCIEPNEDGKFYYDFPTVTFRRLLWNFIFQLTVWADVENTKTYNICNPILMFLKSYYRKKGNGFTAAGWPLVTQAGRPYFKTSFYGLGGSVVRRDWLLASPYDENLDTHGIGDNYGVALGFPSEQPIVVTYHTFVVHHKIEVNRLPVSLSYYRRIMALDYFMSQSDRFSTFHRIALLWSLVGNLLPQFLQFNIAMAKATLQAMWQIGIDKNPYLQASHNELTRGMTPIL